MSKAKDYSDIIDYEYRGVVRHAHMDALSRAAQFSPFAALTGFEDDIKSAQLGHVRTVEDENAGVPDIEECMEPYE